MRIESNSLKGLRVVPENDSDRRVLDLWRKMIPQISSHGIHCDFPGCSGITIGFVPEKTCDVAAGLPARRAHLINAIRVWLNRAIEHAKNNNPDLAESAARSAVEILNTLETLCPPAKVSDPERFK